MPESIVNVTEGSGKKLHTWQRTIGANTVEDEIVVQGEAYLPTYNVQTGSGIVLTTSLAHVLQIMAGASLRVYLRRLMVYQVAAATAAAFADFSLVRLTTAGTGGTAITPASYDPVDGASGCTAQTLPTAKGTEGTNLWRGTAYLTQTIGASMAGGTGSSLLFDLDFDKMYRGKVPIIAAGATNGIALKQNAAYAVASVLVIAVVSEASF